VKKLVWTLIVLLILFVLFSAGTGGVLWYLWSSNLPYIGSLKEYNPPIITEIYSDDGQVIGSFYDEKRIVVPLEEVPKHLIQAFVAAEDARFFEHEGIDFVSIIRAFYKNILAGKISQGGSTITQQVTRSLLLKNLKRTYKRKVREAILSLQIEKTFSKEKILFLYLNQIYLGHGTYGVEAASRLYFDKPASELNLAESAILAGLPQAPSRYSPIDNFDRVKKRQRYVLQQMNENGFITQQQMTEALNTEISVHKEQISPFLKAPYFTEHVRRYLENRYGRDMLYRGGLKVYTNLNLDMQQKAKAALRKGLLEMDKREGYRGPIGHLSNDEIEQKQSELQIELENKVPELGDTVKGIVAKVDDGREEVKVLIGKRLGLLTLSEMKWARKPDPETPYYEAGLKKPSHALKKGDFILCKLKEKGKEPYAWTLSLEQEPKIQGAILSIEARSGRVKAMVGGMDFSTSQFNRAIQSRRQPGSAFKPVIYAAALDYGMTPSTVILDSPYVSSVNPDEDEVVWRPKNYTEKFFGPTLFRDALIHSRNVITIKILKEIGVRRVIEYAGKLGIESPLSPDLSLALGSSGMSLTEITAAYSVFANEGILVKPFFISRIEDRTGQIIQEQQPVTEEKISKDTAYVMTDLLEAVIKEGTGFRIKALGRPAAGKTGTTNDLRDAWFIGFTPSLITGVWVGYDDRHPMGKGETGSRAASPIWLYFMSDVYAGKPVEDFTAPEGVVFAKIDAVKGLLASPYSEKTVFQAYKEGSEPKKYTPKPQQAKADRFIQFDMEQSN
jgi:penicillin-binding protein 1A